MSDKAAIRMWLFALASTTAGVGLSIEYLDRPFAQFLDAHVRHTQFWSWLNLAIHPIPLIVIGALLYLVGCGAWLISGRELRSGTEIPLQCSWAARWAVAAEHSLKQI